MSKSILRFLLLFAVCVFAVTASVAQGPAVQDEKAEAVVKRALEKVGGDRYLQVRTQYSTGFFTMFKDGIADPPSAFVDVIAFPDRERTEFKQFGAKIIQTNSGDQGWIFDGSTNNIRNQRPTEISNFQRGIRTSIETLLRGEWRNKNAKLSYVGRREASLGKRNDVVKLAYEDGFEVEYEFSAEGLPMKSIFKTKGEEDAEIKEEDRFAQFVLIDGVLVPFIVDNFVNGKQVTRINYEKIELNKSVPDSIFTKPADVKQLKKDLKL